MRFGHFYFINMFWAVFAVVIFLYWAAKKRKKDISSFVDMKLLPRIAYSVSNHKLKGFLIVLVFIFSLLALMRPQAGFKWLPIQRRGLDVIIAVDTSKSMLASDVAPNRLLRSKLAIRDLISKLNGDRIGLVGFAGSAFLQCPLTADYGGFLLALDDLNVNSIPIGGTSIASAISTALESYDEGESKYKIMIIITDGEDHNRSVLEKLVNKAKAEGVKIFCLGIGSQDGELIQLTDENGKKMFLKDNDGNVVKSRLNEELLKYISSSTKAAYVRAGGADFGLVSLYEKKLSKFEKRNIKEEKSKLYTERFQIPLMIALMLLLVNTFVDRRRKI
ncbi:MAG: VWA domain-containing protein [Candidatus Omnitrophica bacterium]|nr:VWA domain-containing protein [Candidatus Omnitrophota bacterium]